MCVAFILSNCLEKYLFVLAFNRDEVLERNTRSSHWWEDQTGVVGGRDCVGGGTWLCCSIDGRVAFLTNFRKKEVNQSNSQHKHEHCHHCVTRGALPVNFVSSSSSNNNTPKSYLDHIDGADFNGFNLVVADFSQPPSPPHQGSQASQVYYLTNASFLGDSEAPTAPLPLPPGVHGLSNAVIDAPWPKVALGRRQLDDLAGSGAFDGEEFPWEEIFSIMKNPAVLETSPENLPDTGYGPAFEAAASAIFIEPIQVEGYRFGTRSMAVLAVPRDGQCPVELRERYLTDEGGWAEERHRFHMKLSSQLPQLD